MTTCFAVPTMLFGLLEALEAKPRDMSSLEVITTGGAPVPPDLVRRVRERLGCHLLSAFGQTEHSPMICLNPGRGIARTDRRNSWPTLAADRGLDTLAG